MKRPQKLNKDNMFILSKRWTDNQTFPVPIDQKQLKDAKIILPTQKCKNTAEFSERTV